MFVAHPGPGPSEYEGTLLRRTLPLPPERNVLRRRSMDHSDSILTEVIDSPGMRATSWCHAKAVLDRTERTVPR